MPLFTCKCSLCDICIKFHVSMNEKQLFCFLFQVGKKRLQSLEQVSEILRNRMTPAPTTNDFPQIQQISQEDSNKTDEEYIEIIDKLTKEMFNYKIEKSYENVSMTRSESEYERVMKVKLFCKGV